MDVRKLMALDPMSATLPFRMRVAANVRQWHSGGHLTIAPGEIVLEPIPALRRLSSVDRIVHTKPTVTFIRTRLAPPWINTSIVVEGSQEKGIASTWILARRRLRNALLAAGFSIDYRSAWVSLGGRLLSDRSR